MDKGKQEEHQEKGWKACYLHPSRPAIRDCRDCGKPMCRQCVLESGDPLLCPQCKLTQSQASSLGLKSSRPKLGIGEIVVTEEAEEEKPTAIETGEEFLESQIELEKSPESKVEEAQSIEKEGEFQKKPAAPPAEFAVPPVKFQKGVGAKISKDESARLSPEKIEALSPQASTKSRVAPTILAGLAAAVISFGFWLLIANFRGWTQASVFMTGIAVPWASYKIATRNKRISNHSLAGILWISLVSLLIVGITTPFAEYAAFEITKDVLGIRTFSGFYARHFRLFDWVIIASGVGLSFVFPLFFKIGEKYQWSFGGKK